MASRVCPEANIFHAGAGAFKVYTGTKHRAPTWISHFGIEWLHRIFFEPHTRERYTKGGWLFLKNLIKPTPNKRTKTI
ncbi:MAG: UDP-N-acetyl-D-mannosaminuronic acid transferase (WecB/TagA/CpsF family) [Gammaproteobacteria bacterium]|jgi:UDP-N-acetyl-D-mannosaminuronic acid transferase (WecB/TagA/CpsF family)